MAFDLKVMPLNEDTRKAALKFIDVSGWWDGRRRMPRLRRLEAQYGITLDQARDLLNADRLFRRALNPPAPDDGISDLDLPF